MRKVINAGIDPHRWFAGVMNKVISADLSRADDPEWVKEIKDYLKEHVSDSQRQLAKSSWPFRERSLSKKKVNCWEAAR